MATEKATSTTSSSGNIFMKILAVSIIYFLLRFMGGGLGQKLLYPITLLVSFLHELGHAIGAVITGGRMQSMEINLDGSGLTTTLGGSPAVTLMSGFIGSAIFGNLLFYIGAKMPRFHRITLVFLGGLMIFAGTFWYKDVTSTIILIVFAALLYFIARHAEWVGMALMFFGIASVLYIIQDFNFGPKSDLLQFEATVGFFPANVWKYIWLIVVVFLFIYNIRLILNKKGMWKLTW
jgi:Peptidase M50B-like